LDSFDFSVSKFALYKDNQNSFKVIYHPLFFTDLITKTLRFETKTGDPIAQFSRILKYSRYGFNISNDDKINLLKQINQLESSLIDSLSILNYDNYY
jgi:hypothetical protein